MPRIARTCLIAVVLLAPVRGWAVPAPMTRDELERSSDLVALVRVLAVTCVAVSKDDRTGESLPSYEAELRLIRVGKGAA